jgi:hypothetical protein
MRILACLTALFLSYQAFANSPFWQGSGPLDYPESFHSLIASDPMNMVQEVVGSEFSNGKEAKKCLAALKDHIKARKGFSSEWARAYSFSFDQMPDPRVASSMVYHYTNSEAVKKLVQNKQYSDLFSYGRTHSTKGEPWFLYVASDDKSSDMYGITLLKIAMKPSSRIFFNKGQFPGRPVEENLTARIVQEIISQDPQLKPCEENAVKFTGNKHSILMLLALEHEGIGAIAYYGYMNNQNDCEPSTCSPTGKFGTYQWLQLMGSWTIQNITLDKNKYIDEQTLKLFQQQR